MKNKRKVAAAITNQASAPEVNTIGARFWYVVMAALFTVSCFLVYRIWFSDTSFNKLKSLELMLAEQKQHNALLVEENRRLAIEIEALKNGTEEIETRAREDLGLVKPDEVFYLFDDN